MNYKVILFNSQAAEQTDLAGNFEFYTQEEAVDCCSAWAAESGLFQAYLWDGSTLRYYT